MSNKYYLWIPLLALSVSAFAQDGKHLPSNETDLISEKELTYLVGLCETCHGSNGVSQRDDVPALAGRPADELVVEIERFHFYERDCPNVPVDTGDVSKGKMSMCDVTNQINKQDALVLAQYFEKQDPG